MKNYANLSRGMLCGHQVDSIVRIQSTQCEARQWDEILKTLDADFLYNLAIGEHVVVHDKSEKLRETRACWQGLPWIYYACHRAWRRENPTIYVKNWNTTGYFSDQYDKLTRRTKRRIKWFSKYDSGLEIKIESCYRPGVMVGSPYDPKRVCNQPRPC